MDQAREDRWTGQRKIDGPGKRNSPAGALDFMGLAENKPPAAGAGADVVAEIRSELYYGNRCYGNRPAQPDRNAP
jgi:hypothetical protein